MNDPIKKDYDIASIRKDIQERQQMINEYQMARRLDRDIMIGFTVFKNVFRDLKL